MRFLALSFPRLGIQLARRAHPGLAGKPLALVTGESDAALVTVASVEATADGVEAGMTVAQARQRCPGLLLEADNAGECLARLEALATSLATRTTPRVAMLSRSAFALEIEGLEEKFSDEGAVARTVLGLVRSLSGLDVRAAVASTPHEAECASRTARRFPVLCAETPGADAHLPVYEPLSIAFEAGGELTAEQAQARLLGMVASAQPLFDAYEQSYRAIRIEVERGAYRSALLLRLSEPLHCTAEAADALRSRVPAHQLAGATYLRVTLELPGPSVSVVPWRSPVATVHQLAPALPIQRRLLRAS